MNAQAVGHYMIDAAERANVKWRSGDGAYLRGAGGQIGFGVSCGCSDFVIVYEELTAGDINTAALTTLGPQMVTSLLASPATKLAGLPLAVDGNFAITCNWCGGKRTIATGFPYTAPPAGFHGPPLTHDPA